MRREPSGPPSSPLGSQVSIQAPGVEGIGQLRAEVPKTPILTETAKSPLSCPWCGGDSAAPSCPGAVSGANLRHSKPWATRETGQEEKTLDRDPFNKGDPTILPSTEGQDCALVGQRRRPLRP